MRKKVLPHVLSAAALFAISSLAQAAGFSLMSLEIKSGGTMPKSFEFNGFGCSGKISRRAEQSVCSLRAR